MLKETTDAKSDEVPIDYSKPSLKTKLENFPWWFAALIFIAVSMYIAIAVTPSYKEAFIFIRAGLGVTITTTLTAFFFAILLGLLTGLGKISNSVFFRNLATLYVEFIRGVPMLVLIFFIAFVGLPAVIGGLNALGHWFERSILHF